MAEVEDTMSAPPSTTTDSEGATTDDDVHLSLTCVRRGGGSDGGGARIKFLCSFGGRIIPRPSDGALKYIGGETRVLAVPRSIPFREMKKKVEEMFKTEVVAIKYQLLSLSEDLDVLVSVTCDEDLVHMLDEYDRLEMKRSPTSSPRFRVYVFAPQTTKALPAPASPSSRYASMSAHHPHQHQHQHHHHHQHRFFQPERCVATVPVTPSESPRYQPPSYGTVSAGNSPRANAMAAEPPVFEGGLGIQRVRSTPNLGSLVDAAAQHLHHQRAADGGSGLSRGCFSSSSSPSHDGAGPLFLQSGGHHFQHQYSPAPAHVPRHPSVSAGRYVRVGNYLAQPMVPVAGPLSRGGQMPHGEMQMPKKAALIWD